jgi:hypothetical protein
MGKQAAEVYLENGTPLTEAVVEVAKHAELNMHQVRRVCEYANTKAYLNEFEKSGEMRNVTFADGPADPSAAIKELNNGSTPAVQQVHDDYAPPTEHYKLSHASRFSDEMDKVASVRSVDHLSHADPIDDVLDLKTTLEGSREHLISKLSSSGVIFDSVRRDLCAEVQKEAQGGSSLSDIARSWSLVGGGSMLKQAMAFTGIDSVSERGGRIPNPAHPVVSNYAAFVKIASEHRKLERAVEIIDEQITSVNSTLKGML